MGFLLPEFLNLLILLDYSESRELIARPWACNPDHTPRLLTEAFCFVLRHPRDIIR